MRKTGVIWLFVLCCLLLCSAGVSASPFTDVKAGSWYVKAVDHCYDNGYISGMTPTTFGPNVTMTRAMLVTVLYRLEKEPEVVLEEKEVKIPPENGEGEEQVIKVPVTPFSDVAVDTWYTKAVVWGNQKNIVAGFNDGTFRPEQQVTRQEMVALIYRFLDHRGALKTSLTDQRIFNSFPDQKSVGNWAKDPVIFATAAGILCGSDGKLAPQQSSTRAQVASILLRIDRYIANEMRTVTATVNGGGGSIVPAGTFTIVRDSAMVFRFTPNAGYMIWNAVASGKDLGYVGSATVSTADADQNVSITFRKKSGDPNSGVARLVNRTYPIPNAASYVPAGLKKVNYRYGGRDVQLQSEAATALDKMIGDFRAAHPSLQLYAQSGYRSYSYQQTLYNNQIAKQGGNVAKAGVVSAIPGTSEHQLGLAIDVSRDGSLVQSFGSTTQGQWLAANCNKYGFILRFTKDKQRVTGIIFEPWHFRYVGTAVAEEMKRMGVTTLEEYYGLYLADKDLQPYLPYLN